MNELLTHGLPRPHAVGLHAPGDCGPLVHMGRYAEHPVEVTQPHGLTQLIWEQEGNAVLFNTAWSSLRTGDYCTKTGEPPTLPNAAKRNTRGFLGFFFFYMRGTKISLCCSAERA